MANNGNHATLPILEPPYAPDAPPAKTMTSDLSIEIGDAVATGAILLCQVIRDHRETGVFDPEIKDAIAGRIAKVVELQLDYEFGDDQFLQAARDVGHRALRRHFTDDHDPVEATAAINICIDGLLEVVTMVVRDERIFRVAWAS